MNLKSIITCLAVVGAAALAEDPKYPAAAREEPEKYWKFEELCKVPAYREGVFEDSKVDGLRDLMVSGYAPDNKPAEFFAYVGMPSTPKPKKGYPGIVLVHGGGGTAYPNYVKRWVNYGFAVIALDWYNQRPVPLKDQESTETNVPREKLEGGKRNDYGANVANMVLCNSLLRSLPDVDPDRIAFVGLSWGSWYGAIVASVDKRLKGVVEIYCGDYTPNSPKFINGRFLHAAKVPMYWVASTHDQNVTLESLRAAFNESPTTLTKSLVVGLGHSHAGFEFDSPRRMASHFIDPEKTPSLPILGSASVKDGIISAEIKSEGLGIGKTLLCYSCSSKTEPRHKWKWETIPAERNGNVISAKIPEGTSQCFLSAYEQNQGTFRDLCGTTEAVDINMQ